MVAGSVVLQGGGEFGGRMADSDRRALELAGGMDVPVRIIPAAAAPDRNDQRAGANGVAWFRHLGARNVHVVALTSAATASDPVVVAELRAARLIYLLGGFTHHLGQALLGSAAWQAVVAAAAEGAVVVGSSAGAMVLCEWYYDPRRGQVEPGLNAVPGCCVLPHHNTFGRQWAPHLVTRLPGARLLGIDEQTGLVHRPGDGWEVLGAGGVTVYHHGQVDYGAAGSRLKLSGAALS